MDQDLNNLLFQYAVAKGSIADPHDDDDFLVLGELAASIADVYRCKPGDAYFFCKSLERHLQALPLQSNS